MDVQSLKRNIDLLELIGRDTRLKKVASTGGGEWAGPCPFCGGRDRLRVQPERGLWWCRQCSGEHWQDAIAYVMRRNNQDFKSALAALGGVGAINNSFHPAQPTPSEQERIGPPNAAWQAQVRAFVKQAQATLWSDAGGRAIAWLHARGLTDETIQIAQLGYNPTDHHLKLSDWCLPDQDNRKRTLWIPRGIVIPCKVADVVWYINIRRPAGEPKYVKVKGSVRALYLADRLTGKPDLFLTEGEFDALLLHQVAGDLVDVATLGGSSNPLDDVWLPYLLPARRIFLSHDNDVAGRQAAAALGQLSPHSRRWRPLGAHDITDMHKAGGDLRAWVELALSGVESVPTPDSANYVTLTWPADTPIGCPTGRWQRLADGRIQATYTRTELAWALVIAGSDNPAVLAELSASEVSQ